MYIEEAFVAYLKTNVTQKFYPDELPQGTALPAVAYMKVSDVKEHSLTGQYALERPVFQFTVFALKKSESRDLLESLKTVLCDFQGTMGGIYIQKIELQNELSALETSAGGITPDGTTRVYTEIVEFEFNYERVQ